MQANKEPPLNSLAHTDTDPFTQTLQHVLHIRGQADLTFAGIIDKGNICKYYLLMDLVI